MLTIALGSLASGVAEGALLNWSGSWLDGSDLSKLALQSWSYQKQNQKTKPETYRKLKELFLSVSALCLSKYRNLSFLDGILIMALFLLNSRWWLRSCSFPKRFIQPHPRWEGERFSSFVNHLGVVIRLPLGRLNFGRAYPRTYLNISHGAGILARMPRKMTLKIFGSLGDGLCLIVMVNCSFWMVSQ